MLSSHQNWCKKKQKALTLTLTLALTLALTLVSITGSSTEGSCCAAEEGGERGVLTLLLTPALLDLDEKW